MRLSEDAEAALRSALQKLRTRLQVPAAFPPAVLAEAEAAVHAPSLPDEDATELPLFTIDPPGAKDLDQAMYLERRPGGGFRVYYAIADVAAFVPPGGALDTEAHKRVETLYFPDGKVPLHPPALSEGAASLLRDQNAPALLWQHDLDAHGEVVRSTVRRALVRSRAQLDYAAVQRAIDAGTAEEPLVLLREVGTLRQAVEVARGGISLDLPDQEVTFEDGQFRLTYRAQLPVDGWNEQISLMTGMAAAKIMLDSGAGVLRVQGTSAPDVVARVHAIAAFLGIDWPHHLSYADLVRSLRPETNQKHAAFLHEARAMLLKAEYTSFTDHHPPALTMHAAIAAPYAHATAPLRRLVDRYSGELAVAACAGQDPPAWVLAALPGLPADMKRSKGSQADGGSVDIMEAALLLHRKGEFFDAALVDTDAEKGHPERGQVQLADPPVVARVGADRDLSPLLGTTVRVRLDQADPAAEHDQVLFTLS